MNPAWQHARDILCVRLDTLGDVLMCTPALRALRDGVADRRLTLLTSPSGAAALPFIPEVDAVIAYEAPWMTSAAGRPHQADMTMIALLAERRFDAAVIFTSYTQSALPAALLCHLAGIPLRLAHCRENPHGLLSDWIPDPEPDTMVRHEVQRQLGLVKQVGCRAGGLALSFALRPADLIEARSRLDQAGLAMGQRYLLLHPGASEAARRYPAALWAEAARGLARATGLPLVFVGNREETALIDGIRAACAAPTYSLAGRLDLGQLGAAIRMAAVMISNNTGPAHVAAAVGTPLVELYALTHPQHTSWKVRNRVLFHDVPCRFCLKSTCPLGHHACLAGVPAQRVVDAVLSLLEPAAPPADAVSVTARADGDTS